MFMISYDEYISDINYFNLPNVLGEYILLTPKYQSSGIDSSNSITYAFTKSIT